MTTPPQAPHSHHQPATCEPKPHGAAGAPTDHSPHAFPDVYLTADIPGTGGSLRARPEDFLVDEVPAFQPVGHGEHIYMLVQKRGLSTQQLVSMLARHFRVPEHAVGYAGLKDKHAITRQVISVHTPGRTPEDFPSLTDDRVSILWTDLHTSKLRRGQLRGNRFSIRIRNVALRSVFDAVRTLKRLADAGVPNRLGQQRFGMLGNNHLIGRALLLGQHQEALDLLLGPSATVGLSPENTRARELYAAREFAQAAQHYGKGAQNEQRALQALARGATPAQATRQLQGLGASFYISALQSAAFNRVLDARLRASTFDRLQEGDLAMKHDNGAVFAVDAPTLADPDTTRRLRALEISPTGPMWGPDMLRAGPAIDRAELAALAELGLCPDQLAAGLKRLDVDLSGQRRALRVPLLYPEADAGGDEHGLYVRCSFELPAGAFATVVMEEIMKVHQPGEGELEHGAPAADTGAS
jgi:tRNA pseudouridine13 synthase